RGRSLAQPRAHRAARVAGACGLAGPQPDADPRGGTADSRRAPAAGRAHPDARRRRGAPADRRAGRDGPLAARGREEGRRWREKGLLLTRAGSPQAMFMGSGPQGLTRQPRRGRMAKFIIEPHFRLQEWVAEEKGYFKSEGLEYEFRELVQATDGKIHDKGDRVGAFQSFEKGRAADVSCACHWTVGVAASSGHGKLYPDLYSVTPAGVFVPPDSPVKSPGDLAGVPI